MRTMTHSTRRLARLPLSIAAIMTVAAVGAPRAIAGASTLSLEARLHNDDGILTVLSMEPVDETTLKVTASLIYSEDEHPVDDAAVEITATAAGGEATAPATQPMTFTGTPGTYSADLVLRSAGEYAITINSADPLATVTQNYAFTPPAPSSSVTVVSKEPPASTASTVTPVTTVSTATSEGVELSQGPTPAGNDSDSEGSAGQLALFVAVGALAGLGAVLLQRYRQRAKTDS